MVGVKTYPNLPDIIREVQRQLVEAQNMRIKEGDAKFLKLKQVEFEMKCIAVENAEVRGGFDLKVVSLNSGVREEKQHVHTVKIVFEGVDDFIEGRCGECGSNNIFTGKDGVTMCNACGSAKCG